jgi:hypothetical protein
MYGDFFAGKIRCLSLKMKLASLFLLLICGSKTFSQDNPIIQHIDSVVYKINHSGLPEFKDSISQDYKDMGLSMKTYMTYVKDAGALKKYVNYVISNQQVNGVTRQMIGSTSFYFDQNKFIKAEDFAISEGKEINAAWYFDDGKCIYPEVLSEKDEKRVKTLITIGDRLRKQVYK